MKNLRQKEAFFKFAIAFLLYCCYNVLLSETTRIVNRIL